MRLHPKIAPETIEGVKFKFSVEARAHQGGVGGGMRGVLPTFVIA